MAAAVEGIEASVDETLLVHPILGDAESRETSEGVRALVESTAATHKKSTDCPYINDCVTLRGGGYRPTHGRAGSPRL